jgi:hypothetical protein
MMPRFNGDDDCPRHPGSRAGWRDVWIIWAVIVVVAVLILVF